MFSRVIVLINNGYTYHTGFGIHFDYYVDIVSVSDCYCCLNIKNSLNNLPNYKKKLNHSKPLTQSPINFALRASIVQYFLYKTLIQSIAN